MKKTAREYNWKVIFGYGGAIIVFALSNYWSYESGNNSGVALLIDTMSRYQSFYKEVRTESKIACDEEGKLRGLYLYQYNSMLPVIKDEITPPYDNPCPKLIVTAPNPPTFSVCKGWDTWEDFLADPKPTISINIVEWGSMEYPLNEEWRNSLIKLREYATRERKTALSKCPEGKECDTTTTEVVILSKGKKVNNCPAGETCRTELNVKLSTDSD